ncbi:hypothetical protein BDV95DRAFT_547996 [Massariosphaeria phaeospora]|uniref:PhoD-like phosphatase domain-containing protein n=1 Tax=Massariosphaeria phaeospora TaxID=100035 RepID=A0A7C8I531_9PLEO|nr:hypothetical protein BDV95DRAFT_547996 [Massariosphaeria phaeospora]
MENNRNSGAYSSRTANPVAQPLPDSYPHKRTSYRRPVDAQPAPAQQQRPRAAPAAPNSIPSNSARPVAAAPASNGALPRASSHRRRQSQSQSQSQQIAADLSSEPLPAAPDVPRGPPPTAYRDPYAPKGSSRGPPRTHSGRSRDPTIQLNASRQQPNIQLASTRLQELRAPPYAPVEPLSGTAEGVSRRNSGRRPSVPDRSPLQKLEGKLDDISKEERRARILEIELAAQEKAEADMRARRVREAAERQQRNVSGPTATSDRTASNTPGRTTGGRRHVSMPVPARQHSPDISDVETNGDEFGYDISEPWDPSRGEAAAALQRASSRPRNQQLFSTSQGHKDRLAQVDGTVSRMPSLKGKEPAVLSRGTGSFRDRAGTTRGLEANEPQKIQRKPVAVPTGLGLYGVEDPPNASRPVGANVGRYDSRRLSKDLPPTPRDPNNNNDRRRDSRGIIAAQMAMEQERIDNKQGNRGLDYPSPLDPSAPVSNTRRGVAFAPSVPEPQPVDSQESLENQHVPNVFSHDLEPDRRYVAPPMLDEWRGAPTVTLGAEDLDLDAPVTSGTTKKAWWEQSGSTRRQQSSSYVESSFDGYIDEPKEQTAFSPPLYLKCGPLLRYTGLRRDKSKTGKEREVWRGSVMIVTVDGQSSYEKPPTLRLFKQPMDLLPPPPDEVDTENFNPAYIDPLEGQVKVGRTGTTLYAKPIDEILEDEDLSRIEDHHGLFQEWRVGSNNSGGNQTHKSSRLWKKDGERLGKVREFPGVRLHAERGVTFWRFNLEIALGTSQTRIAYRINHGPAIGFWVPASGETMNIMFHSCNGFSLSVDSKEFCGPDPMWRDVLNNHQTQPFHVMIGGGDQIYNDAAMRDTTLFRQWTESKNPMQKHNASFSSELQNELEQFYLDRYSMWFSQGLFGMASSQIPMVNIWDDHDIIDGFGSYPHHFMQTPVFTGLGAVAFKYYMLFQHQSVVAETEKTEPSWVLGAHAGPYIKEQSRSVFMQLGRQVAFLGLDCRTERQRNEIITEDSYDIILDRLEQEIVKGETKHLIVLLGVPIAYPRLNFLENILTSRLMDPVKAMGRAGLLGNFLNRFDGGVEILDDLDDHWTAKHHKEERNWLIQQLQHLASTKSVRVTILGGDVHLAAVGQFYTNKKANVPKDKDHRYMPNIVSSAIVNTPPPEVMADILNKRNKIHHLDHDTDEDMIPLFTHDVDGKKRNNNHLLPRRNWCSLREYKPGKTPPATPSPPASPSQDGPRLTRTFSDYTPGKLVRRISAGGSRRGRDGPPMAYNNNPAYATADERQAGPQSSFSPDRSERPRSRRNSITSLFKRRVSIDNTTNSAQTLPTPRNRDSSASPSAERPSTFHRRPSMLGKKGVKQQGDYINLQGGLDICLNLEVSQHDPAGITTPYRLLVPALDYTLSEHPVVEKERRKSRLGSVFGVFSGRRRTTVGEDGYSHSGSDDDGSESGSELGEMDDEERARQRYKVGPRILIPGFTNRKRASQSAPSFANPAAPGPGVTSGYHSAAIPQPPPVLPDSRLPNQDLRHDSIDMAGTTSPTWHNNTAAAARRHVSAPLSAHAPNPPTTSTTTTTSTTVARSASARQPPLGYNSSHKSQLPDPTPQATTTTTTTTVPWGQQRRSMGGILNVNLNPARGDRSSALDAAAPAHASSSASAAAAASAAARSKRESYPPHPAIVGAGPGSPYERRGLTSRDGPTATAGDRVQVAGGGDYFSSGGRNGAAASAGVGAKYLGEGRYADDDFERDEDYGDESEEGEGDGDGRSENSEGVSFRVKRKRGWKIWK